MRRANKELFWWPLTISGYNILWCFWSLIVYPLSVIIEQRSKTIVHFQMAVLVLFQIMLFQLFLKYCHRRHPHIIFNRIPYWRSFKSYTEFTVVSSYIWNIVPLFCCKSSIITMYISYPSDVRMEGSRKKLIVEFIHKASNVESYKVKELNYLKRLKTGG